MNIQTRGVTIRKQPDPRETSSMIHRIRVDQFGGPERLNVVEEPALEPALGEVRVRTVAAPPVSKRENPRSPPRLV